ncbi:MAG TPA: DEAD/DEAH box helicase [Planctomycetota bacterium]
MTRFEDLKLIEPLLKALREEKYEIPTPIQDKTIPHVLLGKDVLGCAQTGTGKTAAFALPILQHLTATKAQDPRDVRCLILAPTRELATQIGDSFAAYGRHLKIRHTVIFGGVGQNPQTMALQQGREVVVATPGRLLDLIQQGWAKLGKIEILVLDEADRMLDMGFIHDVKKIIARLPKKRQTLFFSATLPHDIMSLAHDILNQPVRVEVTPTATTVEKISQTLYRIDRHTKQPLLEKLLRDPSFKRTIVFARTKRGANKVAEKLTAAGIHADAIHGNKSQSARERALENFKRGATRVLVATDIAARGIDVDEISHVVNFDMPDVPENYVHRIGRTARAGLSGFAITFCAPEEFSELQAVERLIRMRIPMKPTPEGLPKQVAHAPAPREHRPAPPRAAAGHPRSAPVAYGGGHGGPRRFGRRFR